MKTLIFIILVTFTSISTAMDVVTCIEDISFSRMATDKKTNSSQSDDSAKKVYDLQNKTVTMHFGNDVFKGTLIKVDKNYFKEQYLYSKKTKTVTTHTHFNNLFTRVITATYTDGDAIGSLSICKRVKR